MSTIAPPTRLVTALCLILPLTFHFATAAAQARLGESIEAFKAKSANAFRPTGEKKVNEKTYYSFTMKLEKGTTEAMPKFGAGVTMTVTGGRIVGESMIILLGENPTGSKPLAVMHAMDFAYDAIGKPIPKTKALAKKELDALSLAVDHALLGMKQTIRYPGYDATITFNRAPFGELLIAATPGQPAQSAGKGSN